MSTKNLYYRTAFRRVNLLKTMFLDLFLKLSSYPRLILEVFIRRNFGQRYFSLASAITALVVLVILPVIANHLPSFSESYGERQGFWARYATWYGFVAAFAYFAWLRWKEVKSNPSVFDFARFSLYSGDINPRFYQFNPFGKPSVRQIETIYEPALFFLVGLVLIVFGQKLGVLLMVSSLFYCFCYVAAYKQGDNFVMDKIDEIIMNEEMRNAFVDDMTASEARGVRFYMRKPSSRLFRQKLSEAFVETDHMNELVSFAK